MRISISMKGVAPFKDIALDIDTPITVVYGVSGSGKTTLVNILDCMFRALESDTKARRCLEERVRIRKRCIGDEGSISVTIDFDEGTSIRIDARISLDKKIEVHPDVRGIERISEVKLFTMIVPEDRHIMLDTLCREWRKYAQLGSLLDKLLSDRLSDEEFREDLKTLLNDRYAYYVELLRTIVSDEVLATLSNALLRHVIKQWFGRSSSYVDVSTLAIDGVSICEESLGIREIFALLPVLVALSGREAYQRLGSPTFIAIDSYGLGLTRKEAFLLALALVRLWRRLREEVEDLDLRLFITTHSELLYEVLTMESMDRDREIDELLDSIGVKSLLPRHLIEAESLSLQPEDFKFIEFVYSDGSVVIQERRDLPEYVKNIDRIIFRFFYGNHRGSKHV